MQPILLLHGAIGAKDQLAGIEELLSDSFAVHSLNFGGHGGSALTANPFSIRLFADEVIGYLNSRGIDRTSIFGYSMGGYVALYLAVKHPERIDKIMTLATKFSWDEAIAAKEIKMLDAGKITEKLPGFAATLKARHAPNDWTLILERTAAMLVEMGNDNPLEIADYAHIQQPVLVMLGDRDKMVSLDETLQVYKALPNAQLAVLPNTAHPIEMADKARLASEIRLFLQ